MDFSDIYQRMKFEAYQISEEERTQLTEYLKSSGSTSHLDSNTALLVFCYSSDPTPQNVELVRKFLGNQAKDYIRSAAVTGLYRIWRLSTPSDIDDLLRLLALWSVESRYDSSLAAIGCAFNLMHLLQDRRLSVALLQLLETLHEDVRQVNDVAVGLFRYACWSAYDNWAQRNEERRIHFDTIEEALPIYWDRQKYLLEPIN
ncbi:hypothetical protein AB6802_24130 [Mesorhizobium sp. RCC_202]|uniref:hypothetical protein n=1 Tax=Mesorhizobium sp. RCC_202 TaxID=3239222 RepID=UPI0035263AED